MNGFSKPPSLADLAQQLGLATSTISRALADCRDISEETKVRVRQAAQDLNYTRNTLAASLRKGRSNMIGIIVPQLEGSFFPAVLNSIEKLANKAGFTVLIGQSHEDLGCERQQVALLLAAQVSCCDALRAHGLPVEEKFAYPLPGSSQQDGRVGMRRLLALDQRPDALFTTSGLSAAGAMAELTRQHIQVPSDMAVVCFNNSPFTNLLQPPLTVVDQQAEQMGAATIRMFLTLLKPGTSSRPTQVVLPAKLRVRKYSLQVPWATSAAARQPNAGRCQQRHPKHAAICLSN